MQGVSEFFVTSTQGHIVLVILWPGVGREVTLYGFYSVVCSKTKRAVVQTRIAVTQRDVLCAYGSASVSPYQRA
jgi:hypothetical protein